MGFPFIDNNDISKQQLDSRNISKFSNLDLAPETSPSSTFQTRELQPTRGEVKPVVRGSCSPPSLFRIAPGCLLPFTVSSTIAYFRFQQWISLVMDLPCLMGYDLHRKQLGSFSIPPNDEPAEMRSYPSVVCDLPKEPALPVAEAASPSVPLPSTFEHNLVSDVSLPSPGPLAVTQQVRDKRKENYNHTIFVYPKSAVETPENLRASALPLINKKLFIVFGVPVDVSDDEFIHEFEAAFPDNFSGHFRIKKSHNCSDTASKNIILEASPEVSPMIQKRRRICIQLCNCLVKEYHRVKGCFRCQRIGHLQFRCKETPHCSRCFE
ncbi:unnamed protein product [Larinioides sclopetarius]|uniref:CCHC-type domain-containing protein n=1 Tax=Larinioides sclopetarius TaxID=280406 RepID=A0AAV1YYB3_9ARAC